MGTPRAFTENTYSNLNFYSLLGILLNGMWLQSDIEEYLREFNISHGQYSILLTIAQSQTRPLIASDIAVQLGRSKPTIAKMIDKLITNKYLSYGSGSDDKRKKEYRLTSKASKLLEKIVPGYRKRIDEFGAGITDSEKMLLLYILNKLNLKPGSISTFNQNSLPYEEKSALIRRLCQSGTCYDIDCVLSFLEGQTDIPTTKFVDFYLGTITNPDGLRRIEYYLFNGSPVQRNYCTLFFCRRNDWALVNKAYNLGLVDYKQAYSR